MARLLVAACCLALGWLTAGAQAATIESLLMPGPLIEGHAKFEDNCKLCHESFSKKSQRRLCLKCHKKIAADISSRTGLHGHRAAASGIDCKQCHTDHIGRGADIVLLVPASFDHKDTGFILSGKHRAARCVACHVKGKKYRDAPKKCIACHKEDDAHHGNLGDKCGTCHKSTDWKRGARFDHNKTKFPLHYRHSEIDCAACHPDSHFKNTARQCVACHRINDVHGGRLGSACEKCHSDRTWKANRFDHDKTKFPLRFSHKGLACNACHRAADAKDKPPTACSGCHAADDRHSGRNGEACGDCHNEKQWKDVNFNHVRASGYALRGAHKKLACRACHRGPIHQVALERACVSCHRNDDPHHGELGSNCQQCHNEKKWDEDVSFDHDLTRFPLIGLHVTVPCEACHVSDRYSDAKGECSDCHRADDKHKGALGEACGSCHNPNGWRLWRFDHNRQTKFVLDGAHTGLACDACHRPGTQPHLNGSCISCHVNDDVHHGAYGQLCGRCHVTTRFNDLHLLDKSLGATPITIREKDR